MIKTSLVVAGILSFSAAIAQTTANHIELVVSESVELKPIEAEIRISVETAQSQRNAAANTYEYSEYEYDYDWYEYTEEDYEYEELTYENPKKVTKKMTQEYEERKKQREEKMAARELERAEQLRQQEIELASFDPYDIEDVMDLLTGQGISFTIVNNSDEEEVLTYPTDDSYDWSEYDYELEESYSDSVLSVKVSDSKSYQDLTELLRNFPTYTVVHDIKYETNETINTVVIPKLTEKATSEARALANSFGRKLGKVIQCSNIHPYTPSANYMRSFTGYSPDESTYYDNYDDPFESTKKEIIEYVFRFELLN